MITGQHIERLIMLLVFSLALAISTIILLVGLKLEEGLWRDFISQLGFALITATILTGVTGWYLKDRLILNIAGRVSGILQEFRVEAVDAFQLQRLPPELSEAVRKMVIRPTVIERNSSVLYEFELVEINQEQVLKAKIKSSSTYENLTAVWQTAEIYEGGSSANDKFAGSPGAEKTGIMSISTENVEGSIEPPLDLDQARMRIPVSIQDGQTLFRRTVRFSPRCRVTVKTYEVTYFELADVDWYTLVKPTINMEIKVSLPEGKFDLVLTPDNVLIDSFGDLAFDGHGTTQARISGGLLPGQGIHLQWLPLAGIDVQGDVANSSNA